MAPFISLPDCKYWAQMRAKSSLTQQNVADFLGYENVQIVSRWERGGKPPKKAIPQLLELYHINVDDYIELLLDYQRRELTRLLKGHQQQRSQKTSTRIDPA